MKWFVYMLECNDGSIYTGCTNDVKERVAKHNLGKGAKYTRGRTPVILKITVGCKNRSEALKTEYAFKKLSKLQKEKMIKSQGIKKPHLQQKVSMAGRL